MRSKKNEQLTDFHKKFNETKIINDNKKLLSRFFSVKKFTKIITVLIVISVVVLLFFVLAVVYQKIYANSFFPGIVVADNSLSGQAYFDAENSLAKKIDKFSREGINIKYADKTANISAAIIAESPDASFDIFKFNSQQTLKKAFAVGRGENALLNIKEQLEYFIFSPNIPIDYYLDEQKLLEILQENFSKFENPAQNATITIDKNNELSVQTEKHGAIFDYQKIINELKYRLAYLNNKDVVISLKTDYPTAYAENVKPTLAEAKIILAKAPYSLIIPQTSLKNPGKKIDIQKNDLAKLLGAEQDEQINNKFRAGLKKDETSAYLNDNLSELTNVEPTEAKFEIENGKVTEFSSSKKGQTLNIASTVAALEDIIQLAENSTATTSVQIVIDELASEITNETVNDLGIKELIGSGHSNFAGSPANRRHNIRVGADAVNGTLIKPGEEFSLLKTLGKIDASTGYLPELVIKGNKTIPEYGGGLCQIGTTVFRGSTESGLLITERQNHSYRVSYYEPAGTDATIYDPAPDFKFRNDTSGYVLIQSRIEGDDLYFDFWGTNDGRKITKTQPVIYNIALPPATKLIETDTLLPGEKKCTERAHNGADAYFDYTVEHVDGKKNEVRFSSHYRPWQEVCLIGTEKTATSTLDIINTP